MTATKRRYHHGDLRRALLDAALEIVEESGLSAVSMSVVARRAGVSSGAPYRHFKDRHALLCGLAHRARVVSAQRMQAAAKDAPDPLEGFRRVGVEYVRFAVEEPALFRMMSLGEYAAAGSSDDRPEDVAFSLGLRALLTTGSSTGPLDPGHPLIQQLAARCMVHGLAHLFVDGQHELLGIGPEQAERLAEALTRALGAPSLGSEP